MQKSKLIDLLGAFDQQEMQQFRDFVASPFFNKKEELTAILRPIAQHLAAGRPLRKKEVYRSVFPDLEYDDKRLRYLMSDLLKLAEQFLTLTHYEAQPNRRQLDLTKCFLDRKLYKHYEQERRKIERQIQEEDQKDVDFFYRRLRFFDLGDQKFVQQQIRVFDPHIEFASDYLDRFYFLKKLKYTCGMLDRQRILQGEYRINFTADLSRYLAEQAFFGEDIIQIYYTILMALTEANDDAHFQRLKALIARTADRITAPDLEEIYGFGINYCARKIREGEEAYVEEALQLYLDGIRREVLIQDGVLAHWTFTNVVKLGLRLQRYDWIEPFIWDYAPKLPEPFRENALHYNLAELYYYTQAYGKAQDQLNQVQFSDLNYHLGSRVILAKIYYETGEEEALLSLLAAFTIFLKRNKKISNDLKKTYLNFCHFLFQLLRRKKKQLPKLREEIAQTALLTDRAWLLRAIEGEMG